VKVIPIFIDCQKECVGALKLRKTQSVRNMLNGLAEIRLWPFFSLFAGRFRRIPAPRGAPGNPRVLRGLCGVALLAFQLKRRAY
jgi:hypothetical protein